MTRVCMFVNVKYTYTVEHNMGFFTIGLRLYMYATCFGPLSGHRHAQLYKGRYKSKSKEPPFYSH